MGKKGDGTIRIDAEKHKINNNSIYCLTPGQLRQIESNNNFRGFYITFSRDFLYLKETHSDFSFGFEQYGPKSNLPVISVDEEMQAELEEVASKMVREFANYFQLRSEILKVLLKIFLIYITRKIDVKNDESTQEREVEMVRKFLSSLKKHFVTKKMVSDYAKEFCLTPNYFNQIVKKITGFTASYHIQQQIILEAKRQAIYSGLSMKEVAYALGFDDYIHFSKFFKANSGMNFTSFKKSKGEIISPI